MTEKTLNILLIDDDEDDALLVKSMIHEIERAKYTLNWAPTYQQGLQQLEQKHFHAALVDYDLGAHNGLELIRQAVAAGVKAPLIMVTGRGRYEIDQEVMEAGAADYISKSELNSTLLERAIRHALERRRAEEELERRVHERTLAQQKANELLEAVFSNVHMLIAYLDPDFNFIRVNQRYAAADDRSPSDFVGKNHFDLYPNEENQAIFRRVVETGRPVTVTAKPFSYLHHPERGLSYWDWSLVPVKNGQGCVSGLILSLLDVTERMHASQKSSFQAYLLDHVCDAIYATDENLIITYWNPAAEQIYGWTAAETIGKSAVELLQTQFPSSERRVVRQQIDQTGYFNGTLVQRHKDGRAICVDVKIARLQDESGQVVGYLGTFCDITGQQSNKSGFC